MWGWSELKYADGFTLVLESGEWGEPYDAARSSGASVRRTSARKTRRNLAALPDPEPLVSFPEAVKTPEAGGRPRRRPPIARPR